MFFRLNPLPSCKVVTKIRQAPLCYSEQEREVLIPRGRWGSLGKGRTSQESLQAFGLPKACLMHLRLWLASTSYCDSLLECRVNSWLVERQSRVWSRGIRGWELCSRLCWVCSLDLLSWVLSWRFPKALLPPTTLWAHTREPTATPSCQPHTSKVLPQALNPFYVTPASLSPFSSLDELRPPKGMRWGKIPIYFLELQIWNLFIPGTESYNSLHAVTTIPHCSRGNLRCKSNRE